MLDNRSTACWFLTPKAAPSFVQLGRFGDVILLLPAFLEIYKRTGFKPNVVVSEEYSSVLDGASYVTPHPLGLHWWGGIPMAKEYARKLWGRAIVPAWWNDKECPIPLEYRGNFVLQCHGHEHGVNLALWQNFMTSMYSRAGFTREEMLRLPLVFDRRNPDREAELIAKLYPPAMRKKRLLITNFSGISSPFAWTPEIHPVLYRFARHFHIVDIGNVRAHRIFDIIGVMEIAAGMLHCDSAPLHLAHATSTPYIGFQADGWTGSDCRGNCVLSMRYSEVPRCLNEIADTLQSWANGCPAHLVEVSA